MNTCRLLIAVQPKKRSSRKTAQYGEGPLSLAQQPIYCAAKENDAMHILVLNGPNLNLLGTREPEIYGRETLPDIEATCRIIAANMAQACPSSKAITKVRWSMRCRPRAATADGVVLNAGAYTHTSIALRDAISGVELPGDRAASVEHPRARGFRHVSMIAPVCLGVIQGFGAAGYGLALRAMLGTPGGAQAMKRLLPYLALTMSMTSGRITPM
jgi:3-dehydroquinate dehydratase-2